MKRFFRLIGLSWQCNGEWWSVEFIGWRFVFVIIAAIWIYGLWKGQPT